MQHLIALKDNATEAFQNVHSVRALGQATRDFADAVNDPQNKQLHQHPEDFELWTLGELDETTGKIHGEPRRLMRGQDAKRLTN